MTPVPNQLPRYDIAQSYQWNYDHPPPPVEVDVPAVPGKWQFCGLPVDSPLGMPAGPLLNGRWCLYYASLGFDVLTYKTVRSRARPCYPLPNLAPVACDQLAGGLPRLPARDAMTDSWAVSFGMPSMAPEVWRADVEATRRAMPPGKRLVVSVVGTVEPGWSLDDLADDYARCAGWAVESGADAVEANFSCPNVCSRDGQLYQQPDAAALVAERLRAAAPGVPLIAKIGHLIDDREIESLVAALAPHADALAMVNTVQAVVVAAAGQPLFDGQPRGIAGRAILEASIAQVARFRQAIRRAGTTLALIGVGGASTAADVRRYLDAGAQAVHLATAAMLRPAIALEIRRDWPALN